MTIQFGTNPEYTVELFADCKYWALPVSIHWYKVNVSVIAASVFSVTVRFLCFGFSFSSWRYDDDT